MEENCTPGINDIINVQEWSKGTHPASVAAEAPGRKVTTTSTFHVRCPTPQAGHMKMSRIMKEELLVWWQISLGTLSVCWEPPFLSDIHMLERSWWLLPSTSGQLRGVSGDLPRWLHECPLLCEGHTGLVSDPRATTLKARSCGWHREWARLVGHQTHGLSYWDKSVCFSWTRVGVCPPQSWCGVTGMPAPKHLAEELMFPGGHSEDRGRRPQREEARCALGVPSSEGKGVVSEHSKESAGENPQNWALSPDPRKCSLEREGPSAENAGTRLLQGDLSHAFPASQPFLLPQPNEILRERETGGESRMQPQLPSFLKAFCLKQALVKRARRFYFN